MTASDFRPMTIMPLGLTLSVFLVVSFILCLLAALVLPEPGMRMVLEALLPGFVWLSATGVIVGLLWPRSGDGTSPSCSCRSATTFTGASPDPGRAPCTSIPTTRRAG
ncbi:hypothetical protein [Natronohydrobacter thiooxidans]|uniref:hypothetical protein n=1 Tax=Natronohydrobacter thiooxidans TaxID=87172 RepID=UPI000AB5B8BB|nr:hypothetical protein [Natronohydrobacter thiooxidans]